MASKVMQARKERICKLHGEGKSVEMISSILPDMSYKTIQLILQNAGLIPPEPIAPVDPKEEEALLYFLLQLDQSQGLTDVDVIRQQMKEWARSAGLAIGSCGRQWYFAFLTRHIEELSSPLAIAVKARIIEKHNKRRKLAHPKSAMEARMEKLKLRQNTAKTLAGSLLSAGKSHSTIQDIFASLQIPYGALADLEGVGVSSSLETPADKERMIDMAVVVRDIVTQQRSQPTWKPKKMTKCHFFHKIQSADGQDGHSSLDEARQNGEDLSDLPAELVVPDNVQKEELDDSLMRQFSPSFLDSQTEPLTPTTSNS